MILKTLTVYFFHLFLRNILGVFAICCGIIFMVDFVDRMGEYSSHEAFSMFAIAKLAFFRMPAIAEFILPFAVLVGALATFLNLTRKLELAVVRSAGMSVWQFILPPVIIAVVLGLFTSLAYNPLAIYLNERSIQFEAEQFDHSSSFQSTHTANIWFRQEGPDGESILSAERKSTSGLALFQVTALIFDQDSNFLEQVNASSAIWKDGYWQLNNVSIITADQPPLQRLRYELPTFLTEEQARKQSERVDNITFWSLGETIELAEKSGLATQRLTLKYHSHLALPLLFAAMVIIAATVSLKLARLGSAAKMVLGGIGTGFVLYILSELVRDLGNNGLMDPVLAAWLPAIIALLLGITVLLYQEDG